MARERLYFENMYIYILKSHLLQLVCDKAIVLTGTLEELNVIQSDITSVASTTCTLTHDLKQGISNISLSAFQLKKVNK